MTQGLSIEIAEREKLTTELKTSDVLFGRGSGPNEHAGNVKFRKLVAEHKAEYLATTNRNSKKKIARKIVNTIMEDNGRFLKKVELHDAQKLGIPKGVDVYQVVSDYDTMEKAKRALRQFTKNKEERQLKRGIDETVQNKTNFLSGCSTAQKYPDSISKQISSNFNKKIRLL